MFNKTISSNVAYGKEYPSAEEIVVAAKEGQLHYCVMALPDGYDTTIGEHGLKLAGGEKQRVGIARTLLKNCLL